MLKKIFLALTLTGFIIGPALANSPMRAAIDANARGDYAEEFRITRPLAEKGDSWAQYNLGLIYYNGEGVTQDYAEAAKWYRLAAAQGHAGAQLNLGAMHYNGEGVTQDYAEAAKWYRLAAAQGHAIAQSNLGGMYGNGQGVLQDYVKAHMWMNLAAAKGHANGARNRDIVAKRMTSQQIAEAQKMARDCLARNLKGCD
jgi:TPR repeat protein